MVRLKVQVNFGWFTFMMTDAFAFLFCFAVFASCQGCGSSTSTFDTAAGQVEVTDTYLAGIWTTHRESVVSTPRYRECLAERQALLPVYQSGRVMNWEEMSPIQQSCYSQTTPSAAMGSPTSGGEMGFGGGFGWGGTSQLMITPGIRKGGDK